MTTFEQFARGCGLVIDYAVADGRWHRVPTEDHPRKRNGAYNFDGIKGAVKNWATMQDWATYRPEKRDRPPPVDMARLRRVQKFAANLERQERADAARHSAAMLKLATVIRPRATTKWVDGVMTHPYLERKGFPKAECLVLSADYTVPRNDKRDMVFTAGSLLVPMRDVINDHLVGMQIIDAEGTKLFIPGSRAKGAVFRLGRAHEYWLCEGLATAYSVVEGLRSLYREASVLVCFSAGNIVEVSSRIKGQVYVVADNDPPTAQNPLGAGRAAAEKTGHNWVMPDEVGMDANDLHLRRGINILRGMLHKALRPG